MKRLFIEGWLFVPSSENNYSEINYQFNILYCNLKANLQTRCNRSSIDKVSDPLFQIYSKHCQSQTGRAEILSAHRTLRVICHVSRVTCHVSHVTCHLSPVTCYLKKIINIILRQRGGASWWRVCYQRGLPRLVSYIHTLHTSLLKCANNSTNS